MVVAMYLGRLGHALLVLVVPVSWLNLGGLRNHNISIYVAETDFLFTSHFHFLFHQSILLRRSRFRLCEISFVFKSRSGRQRIHKPGHSKIWLRDNGRADGAQHNTQDSHRARIRSCKHPTENQDVLSHSNISVPHARQFTNGTDK